MPFSSAFQRPEPRSEIPTVYWITGLAGSGKSTLGRQLFQFVRTQGLAVVYLDGDVLREVFGKTGYSRTERLDLAWRYSHLSHMLAIQGINVVCATISLFHEVQAWNRQHLPGYAEIVLKPPFEVLLQRNPKQLYSRGLAGEIQNVVGIDIEPEWPLNPELVLEVSPEISAEALFQKCLLDLGLTPLKH
ncbi:MAG: adenylyl-sulfate kinase [Candidatus Sericytochromatia bacterium]|nr:adenylyl-sulfate kinase [Candidatus Sericytochromatia bacterium]